jgi:hypothetical protein
LLKLLAEIQSTESRASKVYQEWIQSIGKACDVSDPVNPNLVSERETYLLKYKTFCIAHEFHNEVRALLQKSDELLSSRLQETTDGCRVKKEELSKMIEKSMNDFDETLPKLFDAMDDLEMNSDHHLYAMLLEHRPLVAQLMVMLGGVAKEAHGDARGDVNCRKSLAERAWQQKQDRTDQHWMIQSLLWSQDATHGKTSTSLKPVWCCCKAMMIIMSFHTIGSRTKASRARGLLTDNSKIYRGSSSKY